MSTHFRVSPWICILCHFPIDQGQDIYLTSENCEAHIHRTYARESKICPTPTCHDCMKAPQAFPYHQLCYDSLALSLTWLIPIHLWDLGQSLVPVLPVEGSSPYQDSLSILRRSFCHPTLSRMASVCKPCPEKVVRQHCDCMECLLARLSRLPVELLSEHIATYPPWCPLQRLFTVFGETYRLLTELKECPARNLSIPHQSQIFASRFQLGATSYITGLWEHKAGNSREIKQSTVQYEHMLIELDQIGITDIHFLPSESDIPTRPGRWLYAIPCAGTKLAIETKGVFLKRISNAGVVGRRPLWNSSKSPFLLHGTPLHNIQLSVPHDDVLLRYVPLENATGISVALRREKIVAIVANSHGSPRYADADDAIWMHCPLDNEPIYDVWWAYHLVPEYDRSTLIVRTQHKTIWIGCSLPMDVRSSIALIRIATSSISALYYSDPGTWGNRVIGAVPLPSGDARPQIPLPPAYLATPPNLYCFTHDWYYSQARLENVIQAQLYVDGGVCLGVLLKYEEFSLTLGQYRVDKAALECFDRPRWISFIQEPVEPSTVNYACTRMTFYPERPRFLPEHQLIYPMLGIMVWWFGKDKSQITILHPAPGGLC